MDVVYINIDRNKEVQRARARVSLCTWLCEFYNVQEDYWESDTGSRVLENHEWIVLELLQQCCLF